MGGERLIARGVTDARVLEVMRRLPRHLFVDEALRDRAYGDHPLPIGGGQKISPPVLRGRGAEALRERADGAPPLPIGEGQTISQPFIVGRMTELLRLGGREKVLEVGTGCGYQAAVLAELAARGCTKE